MRKNIIGIILIAISGPLMRISLPMMGIQSDIFTDIVNVIASMIFYLAINRYQFDTINELNVSLEQKVEERTRHLRETQARLVQSQKMASMGRLVAGFAHEMNNPLGAITSGYHTISKALQKLHDALRSKFGMESLKHSELSRPFQLIETVSQSIWKGTERVTGILNKLKSFVRLDEADLQEADIHKCIEDTIEIVKNELKPGIEIKTDFTDIGLVTCYPAKLNQLLLLMLDNANRAIEEKGIIRISTLRTDSELRISITDSGIGIPEKNMIKIFDPGFTSWGVSVGVGLGLAICYQIAEEHHGKIEVESEVGKGSTFSLVFPTDLF
jgi:signal transduction histidine kinase